MKRLIDILKKKRQWRQIGAVVLIVCLLGSVLLSNQISGVRAIPDEEKDFWSDASPSNAKHTPDNTGEKDEEWHLRVDRMRRYQTQARRMQKNTTS